MAAPDLNTLLATLMRELVLGSPEPSDRTYILNRGDEGLLASLDRLTAAAASTIHDGGTSIARHADHLRYGLSLLNKWASGESILETDWTESWQKDVLSDAEWKTLRDNLRREATAWAEALGKLRDVNEMQAGWMGGSVAHVAYHLGAIRQIDRATRGPTAEDEARAERALRKADS
jgi:hypothetical protein